MPVSCVQGCRQCRLLLTRRCPPVLAARASNRARSTARVVQLGVFKAAASGDGGQASVAPAALAAADASLAAAPPAAAPTQSGRVAPAGAGAASLVPAAAPVRVATVRVRFEPASARNSAVYVCRFSRGGFCKFSSGYDQERLFSSTLALMFSPPASEAAFDPGTVWPLRTGIPGLSFVVEVESDPDASPPS